MNQWAKEIRNERRAQRIPLIKVAVDAGISVSYLSNLEQGRKDPPPPAVVARIATALGRDVMGDVALAAGSRKAVQFEVPEGDELRSRAAAVLARAWDDDDALEAAIKAAQEHRK